MTTPHTASIYPSKQKLFDIRYWVMTALLVIAAGSQVKASTPTTEETTEEIQAHCKLQMFDESRNRLESLQRGASGWTNAVVKNLPLSESSPLETICFDIIAKNPDLQKVFYPDIAIGIFFENGIPMVSLLEYSDRAGKRAALSHIRVSIGADSYTYWIEPMDNSIFRTSVSSGMRSAIPPRERRYWDRFILTARKSVGL